MPLIPKGVWPAVPYSRNAYNTFLLWTTRLALPEVRIVCDIGANHGDFANAASASFPSADVYLFEPLPHLQEDLKRRSASHPSKWHVMPYALGAKPGTFPLFIDEGDDAIGSLANFSPEYLAANPAARPSRQISCEVRRLDDVISEFNTPRIDLMKVDVEGFEFEVMEGATAALAKTQAVIVEVSLVRQHRRDVQPLIGMCELLARQGFHIVDVIPSLFDAAATWKPAEFNLLARRDNSN